jgi:hypothetical protein
MDIPLDVGASGRSSLQTNWTFYNFPIAYSDLSAGFTTGLSGVSVDARASGQPQYSNNKSTSVGSGVSPNPDNNSLAAPTGPTLFLAAKDGSGGLSQFVRIALSDLPANIALFIAWVQTSEDCENPNGGRYFLCSPFYNTQP